LTHLPYPNLEIWAILFGGKGKKEKEKDA